MAEDDARGRVRGLGRRARRAHALLVGAHAPGSSSGESLKRRGRFRQKSRRPFSFARRALTFRPSTTRTHQSVWKRTTFGSRRCSLRTRSCCLRSRSAATLARKARDRSTAVRASWATTEKSDSAIWSGCIPATSETNPRNACVPAGGRKQAAPGGESLDVTARWRCAPGAAGRARSGNARHRLPPGRAREPPQGRARRSSRRRRRSRRRRGRHRR